MAEKKNLPEWLRRERKLGLLDAMKPAFSDPQKSEQYEILAKQLSHEIPLPDTLSQIEICEYSERLVSEMNFKLFQVNLVANARIEALAHLLAPFYGEHQQLARKRAQDYYRDTPDGDVVRDFAEVLGITEEQIEAEAMLLRFGPLRGTFDIINNSSQARQRLADGLRRRQEKLRAQDKSGKSDRADNGDHVVAKKPTSRTQRPSKKPSVDRYN